MSEHARVYEYDGALRCHDCDAAWGALPGNPTMPETCRRTVPTSEGMREDGDDAANLAALAGVLRRMAKRSSDDLFREVMVDWADYLDRLATRASTPAPPPALGELAEKIAKAVLCRRCNDDHEFRALAKVQVLPILRSRLGGGE